MWVAFLRETFEAFDNFKILKAKVENESGLRIKCLRSNRGQVFTWNQLNRFCEDNGINRILSAPKTPQQNGVEKGRNGS